MILKRCLNLGKLIIDIPKICPIVLEKTYYPEKDRKTIFQRVFDNLQWLFKYHEINHFYTLYGLDIKKAECNLYQDYYHFMYERNLLNNCGSPSSGTGLLRDKYLFYKYMKAEKLPTPEVIALIDNGRVFDEKMEIKDWSYLKGQNDYFVKGLTGECASYVIYINRYEDLLSIKDTLVKGKFLCQKRVEQCAEMKLLNENSLNTLRVITFYNHGKPFVFSAFLRMGTKDTGNVDNWAKGGIAVAVDLETMKLKEYGFFKPPYGTKIDHVPNTKIYFKDFHIPMLKEALEMSCEAQKHFYNVETIGWDVAITNEGITFIEGNDNWEISVVQGLDKPMRKEWNSAYKKCR